MAGRAIREGLPRLTQRWGDASLVSRARPKGGCARREERATAQYTSSGAVLGASAHSSTPVATRNDIGGAERAALRHPVVRLRLSSRPGVHCATGSNMVATSRLPCERQRSVCVCRAAVCCVHGPTTPLHVYWSYSRTGHCECATTGAARRTPQNSQHGWRNHQTRPAPAALKSPAPPRFSAALAIGPRGKARLEREFPETPPPSASSGLASGGA